MKHLVAITLLCALVGCANPGIVQMSQDTYILTRTDKGGIFGNASAMKADVISEANQFAQKQGKVAVPLYSHETPMEVGRGFASFEYQFRVVEPTDHEAGRRTLEPAGSPNRHDVYDELLKLDDLRKRGALSEAEFQQQKAHLLAR
jgi:hypothetical protein